LAASFFGEVDLKYETQFEIAGPAAIFVRPDSGASFVSYPVPTYSAIKGMFECVARWKTAYIKPLRVEICSPIQFQSYVTNYGGPMRKRTQIEKRASYQLFATILVDVCYKAYGVVTEAKPAPTKTNHLHALQDLFNRRLRQGKLYRTPCLGWSEFIPSYFGPLRDHTKPREEVDLVIPSMLHSVFSSELSGQFAPKFVQDARVAQGVLSFA